MAATKPIGSRDDPLVGPTGTGSTSPRRGPVLPRPRTPDETAQVAAPVPVTAPADTVPSLPLAPHRPAGENSESVAPFLELLEDVLAGRSLLGRQRRSLRDRGRRWLLPVGTSGEPLILFCGWLFALAIALAAYADVGPFSGTSDAVLLLSAEGVLTGAVLGSLALAKARRRARGTKADDRAAKSDNPAAKSDNRAAKADNRAAKADNRAAKADAVSVHRDRESRPR